MFDAGLRPGRQGDPAASIRAQRRQSPVDSNFSASQILPTTFFKPTVSTFNLFTSEVPPDLPKMSSMLGSVSPDPVFDEPEHSDQYTDPTRTSEPTSGDNEQAEYDLKPPPPSVSHSNIEVLAERFFSIDHLNLILRDPSLHARFSKFLHQFRPQSVSVLNNYLDIQKATLAIEYANAVVSRSPYQAAVLDDEFQGHAQNVVEELLSDALPAVLTHQLTRLVCESLVREITQTSAPIMRELIPSLAEVYCISDPSIPDMPIVYASEEFYRTTQYGKDYAIGRNCRFLQGPKTQMSSVKRLVEALAAGHEVTETILNYRRDGTPFMNLLLIAPLYDNKGSVRYFLGCQIDVSPLIENGRGIESFAQLLAQDRALSRFGGRTDRPPTSVLSDLGPLLDTAERDSMNVASNGSIVARSTTPQSTSHANRARRVLGVEEAPERLWPHTSLGPSGRLPGVYQNYLLVRPYPSLRITFASPALRIPGLLQTKFLDRIKGPQQVCEGIEDSLSHGTSVTAKILWLAGSHGSSSLEEKSRWIHCTPLMGSDEKVGVWMVVMVEEEEISGTLNSKRTHSEAPGSPLGVASARFTENKLYAEYLRREGRDVFTPMSPKPVSRDAHSLPSRDGSTRKAAGIDAQPFQGF